MTTLYELTEDIRALAELMERNEGEPLTEDQHRATLLAWWAETEGALESKVDRILAYAADQDALAEAREDEGRRLVALGMRNSARATRLRGLVRAALEALDRTSVVTPRFDVAIVSKGGQRAVVVDDVTAIPKSFFKAVPASRTLDKSALHDALAASDDVVIPGAHLAPRGKRLRID